MMTEIRIQVAFTHCSLGLDVGRSHPQLLGQAGEFVVAHVAEVVNQLAERAAAHHHEGGREENDSAARDGQGDGRTHQRVVQKT